MDLTEEMLTGIAQKVCGSTMITYDENQIDFGKWTRLSMKDAILKYSPEKIDEKTLNDRAAVEGLLNRLHVVWLVPGQTSESESPKLKFNLGDCV